MEWHGVHSVPCFEEGSQGVIGNYEFIIIWELLGTICILPEREGGNGFVES
jgi:hypothetical protein